ncbi:hypothetical protein DL767_001021 [Monosporascus sp. MG133]|nr:hypothetical protein DL767_001021 [Monosporascus sp. MG133]
MAADRRWGGTLGVCGKLPPISEQWNLQQASKLGPEMQLTTDDRGFHFYVAHYEPYRPNDLERYCDFNVPRSKDIAIAIGLAALANVTGNTAMCLRAREKYGSVLRQMGTRIRNEESLGLEDIRSVVRLSLFEAVDRTENGVSHGVLPHIVGSIALLMRTHTSSPTGNPSIFKGLIQLALSLVQDPYA